ncbi:amine oxidase [Lyophyllum atratum]|nr:amine oxidase [Lyophyllum atratum]
MAVAVVGSGVSGLAATWLLNEYSDHTVDLYEADSRPGGHAHTVRYTPKCADGSNLGKESIDVDTGFIVFNPSTYPNFLRFLRMHSSTAALILPTEMTFSVSRDGGAFEWAGKNLFTVFCQARNLLDPGMWRLVWDVARFNATAGRILVEGEGRKLESIGEYLDREGYSASFRDNYLIPMTAAIWSTPADKCAMDFPATTLIQFLHNHHLLQITVKPSWLTIKGGSKAYVNQILTNLNKSRVHLSSPVQSLTRLSNGSGGTTSQILLKTSTGVSEIYDHVILACHSDEAVRILRKGEGVEGGHGISPLEEEILSSFQWNRNEVVLHSDVRLMPKRRSAWSCWNYLTKSGVDSKGKKKANSSDDVSLTYGMNDLQHISESKYGPVLVTLNPPFEPHEDLVAGRWKYDHPVLDTNAIAAQRRMSEIQGTHGVSFAGAYLRYGFHEDGFTSGLVAAAALSLPQGAEDENETVRPPFPIEYAGQDARRGLALSLVAAVFDVLEASGMRALVGLFGSAVLEVVRLLLWWCRL